jgi:hypothetical protein
MKILEVFVLLAIVSSVDHFSMVKNKAIIKKIEIKHVDFELTSIISIDCSNFENYFEQDLNTIVIESEKDLKLFSSYVDELIEDKDQYKPDVRAKIFIYRTVNKVDTLCLSHLGLVLNGVPMKMHPKIFDFVECRN